MKKFNKVYKYVNDIQILDECREKRFKLTGKCVPDSKILTESISIDDKLNADFINSILSSGLYIGENTLNDIIKYVFIHKKNMYTYAYNILKECMTHNLSIHEYVDEYIIPNIDGPAVIKDKGIFIPNKNIRIKCVNPEYIIPRISMIIAKTVTFLDDYIYGLDNYLIRIKTKPELTTEESIDYLYDDFAVNDRLINENIHLSIAILIKSNEISGIQVPNDVIQKIVPIPYEYEMYKFLFPNKSLDCQDNRNRFKVWISNDNNRRKLEKRLSYYVDFSKFYTHLYYDDENKHKLRELNTCRRHAMFWVFREMLKNEKRIIYKNYIDGYIGYDEEYRNSLYMFREFNDDDVINFMALCMNGKAFNKLSRDNKLEFYISNMKFLNKALEKSKGIEPPAYISKEMYDFIRHSIKSQYGWTTHEFHFIIYRLCHPSTEYILNDKFGRKAIVGHMMILKLFLLCVDKINYNDLKNARSRDVFVFNKSKIPFVKRWFADIYEVDRLSNLAWDGIVFLMAHLLKSLESKPYTDSLGLMREHDVIGKLYNDDHDKIFRFISENDVNGKEVQNSL